jgi:iron complex outermembrane receptor protein
VHFLAGVPETFPLAGIDDGTGNPVIAGPPGSGAPPVLVPTQALFVALNLDTLREQVTTSYAGYAQGTYNLTERLSATLGARYSVDQKDFAFRQTDRNAPPAIPGVMSIPRTPLDKSWSSFTPRAGLELQLNPDHMLYVSAARGFKSGGFNARPTSNPPRFTSYDPEYLTTYEAGYKSEWLDHRLRLNTAVFHSTYRNIQLNTFIFFNGDYITEVANAGDGHMDGAEAEITVMPHRRFTLSAGVGYLHFGYDRVQDVVGPNTNTPPGKLLPSTPEWTFNASASGVLWQSAAGELALRGDYRYQSETTYDIFNQGIEGGYGVLDGRLSFTSGDGHWGAFILGRNLTDKLYGPIRNFNLMSVAQARVYAAPREWGVGVQYNF